LLAEVLVALAFKIIETTNNLVCGLGGTLVLPCFAVVLASKCHHKVATVETFATSRKSGASNKRGKIIKHLLQTSDDDCCCNGNCCCCGCWGFCIQKSLRGV